MLILVTLTFIGRSIRTIIIRRNIHLPLFVLISNCGLYLVGFKLNRRGVGRALWPGDSGCGLKGYEDRIIVPDARRRCVAIIRAKIGAAAAAAATRGTAIPRNLKHEKPFFTISFSRVALSLQVKHVQKFTTKAQ